MAVGVGGWGLTCSRGDGTCLCPCENQVQAPRGRPASCPHCADEETEALMGQVLPWSPHQGGAETQAQDWSVWCVPIHSPTSSWYRASWGRDSHQSQMLTPAGLLHIWKGNRMEAGSDQVRPLFLLPRAGSNYLPGLIVPPSHHLSSQLLELPGSN